VIRIGLTSAEGRTLGTHFGVRAVPTLIVLDGQGEQVLRQIGRIDRTDVVRTVERVLAGALATEE